ncbi:ankyrin repeat-containing domain protein [Geopyxis carbonaria]|nr:ankyrin repeat-containing domain protein [Geopyxis carbonaria]
MDWILKDVEFNDWDSSEDSRILWISGPAKCKTQHASAHVVAKYSGMKPNTLVFYCFFSSEPRLDPIIDVVHTILKQIIDYFQKDEKQSFITKFLDSFESLLDKHRFKDSMRPTAEKLLKDRANIEALLESLANSLCFFANTTILIVIDGIFFDRLFTGRLPDEQMLVEFFQKVSNNVRHMKVLICTSKGPCFQEDWKSDIHLRYIEYGKERTDCLETLSTTYITPMNNRRFTPTGNSFQWFWHPKLPSGLSWMNSSKSQVLYVEGKLGSGKSTLANYLHQEIPKRLNTPKETPIILVFQNTDKTAKNIYQTMLITFLNKLLEDREELFVISNLQEKYRQEKELQRSPNITWPDHVLCEIFISIITEIGHKQDVYLILDLMLDHAESRKIAKLLRDICAIQSLIVKVFLTSRQNSGFDEFHDSEISFFLQEVNGPDIKELIYNEIDPVELQQGNLTDYIFNKALGVILWVSLVTSTVKKQLDRGNDTQHIFQFLQSLPNDIENFYKQMFQDLENSLENDGHATKIGRSMLEFVLFSKRPLNINELEHAVTVPGISCKSEDFRPNGTWLKDNMITDMEKRMDFCAGGFLEPDYIGNDNSTKYLLTENRPVVQFLHGTAREFFLKPSDILSRSKLAIRKHTAHDSIAAACLQYLQIFCSQCIFEDWSENNVIVYVDILESMHFMQYILRYLPDHIESRSSSNQLDYSFLFEIPQQSPAYTVLKGLINNLRIRLQVAPASGSQLSAGMSPRLNPRRRRLSDTRQPLRMKHSFEHEHEEPFPPTHPSKKDTNDPAKYTVNPFEVKKSAEPIPMIEISNVSGSLEQTSTSNHFPMILQQAFNTRALNAIEILLEGPLSTRLEALKIVVKNRQKEMIPILFKQISEERGRMATIGLLAAAEHGHKDFAEIACTLILEYDAQPNEMDKDGMTVLAKASRAGNISMVKLLLEQEVDVNAKNNNQLTALNEAVLAGHESIVELLLNSNAHVDGGRPNETPLIEAVRRKQIGIINLLVSKGANVMVKDANLTSSLTIALSKQTMDLEIARILVENGADVHEIDKNNQSALMSAVVSGQCAIVKFLLHHGAGVNERDSDHQSLLIRAILIDNLELVKILIAGGADVHTKDNQQRTSLMRALSELENFDIADVLLKSGVDATARDKNQHTALMKTPAHNRRRALDLFLKSGLSRGMCHLDEISSPERSTQLIDACRNGNFTMAKFLLDLGVDVNEKDAEKMTALMSCRNRQTAAVLLEYGADVKLVDAARGRTALLHAVVARRLDVVEILIEYKSDVNARDITEDSVSPLMEASRNGDFLIAKVLLENGAECNEMRKISGPLRCAAMSGCRKTVDMLLKYGAIANANYDQECLRDAVKAGHLGVVQKLLVSEEIHFGTSEKKRALMISAEAGNIEITEELLKHGARVNSFRKYDGETPLMKAVKNGHEGLVKVLLHQYKADRTVRDRNGRTAVEHAGQNPSIRAILTESARHWGS